MNQFLIIFCCILLGLMSCQKEKQEKIEKRVLLTKVIREVDSFTYIYDDKGRLATELYQTEIGSYITNYTDYSSEGWLSGYTINYAEEQETDLRCKNTFDQKGRLIRVDQYRLEGDNLMSYALIDYAESLVTRRSYDGSSSLIMIDKFYLSDDGKNVAKHLFYTGHDSIFATTTTYVDYDDKKNPKALLPAGYNPWNLELSYNNVNAYIWVTKSAPAGTQIHFARTYEYNADGYPITSNSASEFESMTQKYEYRVQ